jgi:uncharacterized protein (DUF1919 family)
MTNFIYFDVMNMYEVMPSIRYFNLQCHYAAGITLKILKSIQTFNEPFVPLYISNIDPLKAIEEYNYFLDNKY